jgi:hypothetical protein
MTPDEQTVKLAEYLSFLAGIKDAAKRVLASQIPVRTVT